MEPFKNRYNKETITEFANSFSEFDNKFDHKSFIKMSLTGIKSLEMKARAQQISDSFASNVDGSQKNITKNISNFLKGTKLEGFILWPLSLYIEKYYINDFNTGMNLLTDLTKVFTSEFGIRPFFEKYPEETYLFLSSKIDDKNEHVRRWICEGTRPNLPWGSNISHLNSNLKRNIKLIEKLKNDTSLYVRKSVANHMSDISMIDPDLALTVLEKWHRGASDNQYWIIKQSIRNLIKKGNIRALSLLGFDQKFSIDKVKMSIRPIKISKGESTILKISFLSQKKQDLMIDYQIGYLKKSGDISYKVFKLKSFTALKNEEIFLEKKVSFKDVTTRVHYPGKHLCRLQVNGNVMLEKGFHLLES